MINGRSNKEENIISNSIVSKWKGLNSSEDDKGKAFEEYIVWYLIYQCLIKDYESSLSLIYILEKLDTPTKRANIKFLNNIYLYLSKLKIHNLMS